MRRIKHGERKISRYESPIRKTVSDSRHNEYKPLKHLKDARKFKDAYMIMEGDYGGQIYLSIPIKKVKCNYRLLERLLNELDEMAWNDSAGSGIYFERIRKGSIICGGMGGSIAKDGLWVHKDFVKFRKKIELVTQGKATSIGK